MGLQQMNVRYSEYKVLAYHTPFPIRILVWEVERNRENIDIRKVGCQFSAPVLEICPVWERSHVRVEWIVR